MFCGNVLSCVVFVLKTTSEHKRVKIKEWFKMEAWLGGISALSSFSEEIKYVSNHLTEAHHMDVDQVTSIQGSEVVRD